MPEGVSAIYDINIERLTVKKELMECGTGYLHQYSVSETYHIHTHCFWEFSLVLSGNAVHSVNGSSQILKKGSFMLIRPNDIHCYEFLNNDNFEMINASISCEDIETAFGLLSEDMEKIRLSKLPTHIVIDGYRFITISRLLSEIPNKEYGAKRKSYVHAILPLLLYTLLDGLRERAIPKVSSERLTTLLNRMEEDGNYAAGLERLVELSGVSQEYLNRLFRRELDMTPTEFINMKRIGIAARLLTETDEDVLDISYDCGFSSLSYFNRIFKKQMNCTPKRFRELNKKYPESEMK